MEKTVKAESRITMIPVCRISCGASVQRGYSRRELSALSKSIEKNGILQPLTVRDITPYRFELISGERRLRAAVMLGISRVPCIILHCSQRQSAVYSIVENLQREQPSLFDRAEELRNLTDDLGFTSEQAAAQLGISQKQVKAYLSLLIFSPDERDMINDSELTLDVLGKISAISVRSHRIEVLKKAIEDSFQSGAYSDPPIGKIIVKDMRIFYNTIEKAVATMRRSGINAEMSRRDSDGEIEYRILISK